jgi:hypothetical protein
MVEKERSLSPAMVIGELLLPLPHAHNPWRFSKNKHLFNLPMPRPLVYVDGMGDFVLYCMYF